ncbi:hypothetical protein, partial [Curtobacterium sp. MCBA15_008]|uniref:hypothetical protein n=1 Tax=Curtobacterium sp. MCBA15_008 TaxID=1898736 RepID=UPI001C31CC1F
VRSSGRHRVPSVPHLREILETSRAVFAAILVLVFVSVFVIGPAPAGAEVLRSASATTVDLLDSLVTPITAADLRRRRLSETAASKASWGTRGPR